METTESDSPITTDQFARHLFRELHLTILQHETGAMTGDVESVHDMRVGIRRLRVAMNNFAICFHKPERRRWRAKLENLAAALGKIRDLDVMIEALKRQAEIRTASDRVAITSFVSRLRVRRRRALQNLKSYFSGEEYLEFKQGFSADANQSPAPKSESDAQ